MRITNKIMHNNSIYNINNNKVTEDGLNTQIATGKKLTRPSDDPVIAIRALRLRSNVTELSQYVPTTRPTWPLATGARRTSASTTCLVLRPSPATTSTRW